MEGHIAGGKAFGLKGIVQGIVGDGAAVHRQEYILPVSGLPEPHKISKPAFQTAALIVIASGALFVIFRSALKAIHVKLPHIIPDAVKILYQLAVYPGRHLLPYC